MIGFTLCLLCERFLQNIEQNGVHVVSMYGVELGTDNMCPRPAWSTKEDTPRVVTYNYCKSWFVVIVFGLPAWVCHSSVSIIVLLFRFVEEKW